MDSKVRQLYKDFNCGGQFLSCHAFTSGHINTTWLIKIYNNGKINEYVLQKINKNVFKKPEEVMENIVGVTKFIEQKMECVGEKSLNRVLRFCPSMSGKYYTIDENGEYWRMYEFVDQSVTFDTTNSTKILEETGRAFGEFQLLLSDFPIEKLNIIIPHFHNTKNRYSALKQAVQLDKYGRKREVSQEIKGYLELECLATKMYGMQKNGRLNLRVTHNDTKCNNVLFHSKTQKHLCVIDLDTVMPGLIGFDFGDAIRFGASTAVEDEKDLSKVKINLNKFKAFAKGFLNEVALSLTQDEKDTLVLGAITMTLECGARFLTDYLDGDKYFKIAYEGHNLDRARCQLALAKDMIKNYTRMCDIVNEIYSEVIQENRTIDVVTGNEPKNIV